MRHSVHWTARLSLRASRHIATSCGCEVILLPKPPPMSWVTKRSLSRPQRDRRPHHDRGEAGELVVAVDRPLAGAAVVLDERAVALERGRVEAVEVELADLDDPVGLGDGVLPAAPLVDALPDEVRAGVGVEDGRVRRRARGGRRRSTGERLVVDLDELGGVAGELARLGDDDRDRVADEADAADGERVVLDLRAGRRRELEERVGQRRDLVAGQRPVDARERERRRDVDRRDQRVGVGRADEVRRSPCCGA